MPKPRPLTPEQARRSFANRFAPRADRLRQIAVKFGVRPYRVALVWTKWGGPERGRGREIEIGRTEILPTPLVRGLDNVQRMFFSGGLLPVGSIRVTEISALFTQDQLTGLAVPRDACDAESLTPPRLDEAKRLQRPSVQSLPEPLDFFWEVFEDGRGDNPSDKTRYRLSAWPMRNAEQVSWECLLERVSNDPNRDGSLNSGFDPVDR